MKRRLAFGLFLLILSLRAAPLDGCTTFCARTADGVIFGRNYDFEIGDGALVVNTRGLVKRGFLPRGPAWTSAYGSVTFNQFGRDFPMGGMNERGLVVELMWLDVTTYPAADDRAELGVLEWIQYQLDTSSTVAEVVASDRTVRIAGIPPLHYLVSDSSGASTTIEYLDGRLVAHTGASLPVAVLANGTYEDSLRFWRRKGESSLPGGSGSEARFARAASQVGSLTSLARTNAIDRAFAILASVAQGSTRWTIVYDHTSRVVHFRTDRHTGVRVLRLDALDLACSSPARTVDLQRPLTGDLAPHLEPYSTAANAALVEKNYHASSVTRRTPPAEIRSVASHPEQARCEAR
jgi:penicillin V acylase-like amidase (Ntn superfamily)